MLFNDLNAFLINNENYLFQNIKDSTNPKYLNSSIHILFIHYIIKNMHSVWSLR